MVVPGLKNRKPLPDHATLRERIGRLTAFEFGITYQQMFLKSRRREYVISRQVSMFLVKKNDPTASLKVIGIHFGGKDHTTVIHAVKTVTDQMSYDEVLRERVNKIQEML